MLSETVHPCSLCGGPVVLKGMVSGTRYYVPVADVVLKQMMDHPEVDQFIRERLQRAERIIVDLREQLDVVRKSGS